MSSGYSPLPARTVVLGAGLFLSVLVAFSVVGTRESPPIQRLPRVRAPLPLLSAEAYMVGFAGEAEPLISLRLHKRLAPASLTKIMTVFLAREHLAAGDRVVFSSEAKAVEEHRSDAAVGESFSRDDMARMALMASANDAALALADAVGAQSGSAGFPSRIAFFMQLMNERARAIGMPDTHFENPVGLDAPGHFMSAADIGRMVAYVLVRNPGFFAATRDQEATVFSSAGKKYTITSTDELLAEFPAIAGGKTGFTDNAKGALLLLYPVREAGREKIAIIVILKSEDRFGDGRKLIMWLEANCLASRGDLGEHPCEP